MTSETIAEPKRTTFHKNPNKFRDSKRHIFDELENGGKLECFVLDAAEENNFGLLFFNFLKFPPKIFTYRNSL